MLVAIIAILSLCPVPAKGQDLPPQLLPPPELLPPPRPVGPPFALTAIPNGYQIILSRGAAEMLSDALDAAADEKQIAKALRDEAAQRKGGPNADADTVAKLELAAFLVSTQLPAFKKALHEKMGPCGVVIRVTGLQAPEFKFKKPRPALQRAIGVARGVMPLLPVEMRESFEGLRAMARTTPLAWTVEPRP